MSLELGTTNISLVNQGSTISNRGYLGNDIVYGHSSFNTLIGGIGVNVTNTSLLSSLLGTDAANIYDFTLDGNNVSCNIYTSYALPTNAFNNTNGRFVTYFNDITGNVTNIGGTAFKTVSQRMSLLYFPGIINCTGTSIFQDADGATLLDMPNCTSVPVSMFGNWNQSGCTLNWPSVVNYGSTQGDDGVFTLNASGVTLNAAASNETSNGGGVEGDVAYLAANGGTVNYV